MNRNNTTSWFPLEMFVKNQEDKKRCKGILFGPAKQVEHVNFPYPNEKIEKDETVIWNPRLRKTVSLKSYEKAHLEQDTEILGKFTTLGLPLGCTFGGTLKWPKTKKNLSLANKIACIVSNV